MTTIQTNTNRIAAAIGRYNAKIEAMGGEDATGLNGKRIGDLHADMALSLSEFVSFQNLQAQAHASGRITMGEAQLIYMALGGEAYQGDWPEGTSLATKVTITQIMEELLK